MPFQSATFLFAFLPATLLAYEACGRWWPRGGRGALAVLLAASLGFYAAGDPRHLPLLAASIAGNFALAHALHRARRPGRRRWLLALGVVANVAVLAAYKLGAGPVDPSGTAPGVAGLARLPLGLSFFTLQQVAYLVDQARDDAPPPPLAPYALYVAFFPHVVAGPIVRFRDVAAQYPRLARGGVDADDLARGLGLLVAGLGKKLLLADPLGRLLDPAYAQAARGVVASLPDAWVMAWGFLLQLYFDFSAYSDMAIGLALAFGLRLPVNFNSPLRAASASEFFARWHVSLSAFVRDFVFAPLFRVARRLPVRSAPWRQVVAWCVATFASLVLVGLWHSTAPTFVLAGVLIAATAVAYQLAALAAARRAPRPAASGPRRARRGGRAAVLLGLTVFSVFFRADGLHAAWAILAAMVDAGRIARPVSVGSPSQAALLLAASAVALALPNTGQVFGVPGALPGEPRVRWRPTPRWSAALAVLTALVVGLLRRAPTSPFIYVQF